MSRYPRPCCCMRHEHAKTAGDFGLPGWAERVPVVVRRWLELGHVDDDGFLSRPGYNDDRSSVRRRVFLAVRDVGRHPDVIARLRLQPDELASCRGPADEGGRARHDEGSRLRLPAMGVTRGRARWALSSA